jgi:predicted Zn-dependent protease
MTSITLGRRCGRSLVRSRLTLLALALFAITPAAEPHEGFPSAGRFATSGPQSADIAGRNEEAARAMREGRYDEAVALYRDLAALSPNDPRVLMNLGAAYSAAGKRALAVAALRKATELAPRAPSIWYALGQAYNDIKQDALGTFEAQAGDEPWRQLLAADALLEKGPLTDAFVLYRAVLEQLPWMVSIHDSVARIYDRTGHAAWAVRERRLNALPAPDCARRKALCDFRAERYASALTAAFAGSDAESRYWRARAANELALAAFKHLEGLPDSAERRAVRATVARAEERYTDAVAELKAALNFSPDSFALVYELGSAYHSARDYDRAVATLSPLLDKRPDDIRLLELVGDSLLQLRRPEEALPVLQRAVDHDPSGPASRLALGRAYLFAGNFAAAVRVIEPLLAADRDGSLHVQLARAYSGVGQKEKAAVLLARSQELQRAAEEREAAAAQRTITPPK